MNRVNGAAEVEGWPILSGSNSAQRPAAVVIPESTPAARFLFKGLCFAVAFAVLFREFFAQEVLVAIGSYNFLTTEPIIFFSFASIVYVLATTGMRMSWALVGSLGLSLMAAISLGRGILLNSFTAFFVARAVITTPLFIFFGLVAAGRRDLAHYAVRTIQWTGCILAVLVMSRILFGFPISAFVVQDGRPILNYGALTIGMASILYLSDGFRLRRSGNKLLIGAALFAVCLCTRQGTATLATLVALGILLVSESGRGLPQRWLLAFLGVILMIVVMLLQSSIVAYVFANQEISLFAEQREGTNQTRQMVWESFLYQFDHRALFDKFFGTPMGVGENLFVQMWGGTYWDRSLHSMYFEVLRQFGYIGLGFYVLVLASTLFGLLLMRSRSRNAVPFPLSRAAALAITMAVAVFGYSYDFRSESSVFLMLSVMGLIGHRRNASQSSQVPLPAPGPRWQTLPGHPGA